MWLLWLLATALAVLSTFVEGLSARGSSAVLHLQTARTSATHPLHASEEVTLWCAPDNLQITIRKAWFVRKRDKKRFEAQLSANKKNATLTFPSPTVGDAGEYMCELDTQHGRLTTLIHLYARPVSVTDHDHFTVKENNEFHLEGERKYVLRGDSTNITCPVFGYPTPGIKWTKDGNPLELSDKISLEGIAVLISEADYDHAGLYTCEAVNEYTAGGKTSKPLIVIEKILDVKMIHSSADGAITAKSWIRGRPLTWRPSNGRPLIKDFAVSTPSVEALITGKKSQKLLLCELGWIYPLVVIFITLIVLFIVIGLCEVRKRRQSRQSRYISQE